jgi:single-strand DNA-binding protein
MLIGNLGRDPEIRSTQSGNKVANLSVATERRWTDKDGDRQKATTWHDVTCWSRQADFAESYLKKGSRVYVEGQLDEDEWTDKETGQPRRKKYVVAYLVLGLDRKGEDDGEVPF